MICSDTLRAIVESSEDSFRALASTAGGHPMSFYRGANFDDADLRGEDLRGFNLDAATFKRARVDRRTRVNSQYETVAGLKRFEVPMVMTSAHHTGLEILGITLEEPEAEHVGDMLEEATFQLSKTGAVDRIANTFKTRFANNEDEVPDSLREKVLSVERHEVKALVNENTLGILQRIERSMGTRVPVSVIPSAVLAQWLYGRHKAFMHRHDDIMIVLRLMCIAHRTK